MFARIHSRPSLNMYNNPWVCVCSIWFLLSFSSPYLFSSVSPIHCYPSTFLNRMGKNQNFENDSRICRRFMCISVCAYIIYLQRERNSNIDLNKCAHFYYFFRTHATERANECLCVVDLVILLFTSSLRLQHILRSCVSVACVYIAPHLSTPKKQ